MTSLVLLESQYMASKCFAVSGEADGRDMTGVASNWGVVDAMLNPARNDPAWREPSS